MVCGACYDVSNIMKLKRLPLMHYNLLSVENGMRSIYRPLLIEIHKKIQLQDWLCSIIPGNVFSTLVMHFLSRPIYSALGDGINTINQIRSFIKEFAYIIEY